jgi:alpha-glucosidase
MPHLAADQSWWQHAVIYQIYIRSFADGNDDGIGDLIGLRSRLPYLCELGVDAIWITPWYPTPNVDGGYDVAHYTDINPEYGTLADAEALIEDAHRLGIRVIADIVPNHTSDQHAWFRRAAAAPLDDPARDWYWIRPGAGARGEDPPNNWQSLFGGPAWTRLDTADWYLHLFSPAQPDLNWTSDALREEFASILRFWFDRGVDGFRIDVAHGLTKDPELPDIDMRDGALMLAGAHSGHPHWDRDATIDIYRQWRTIADSYPEPRMFVAEAWVENTNRLRRYVGSDALHSAFNFGLLGRPWDATELRKEISDHLADLDGVAPATWVLSNHDVVRHVTRYGRQESSLEDARRRYGTPVDLAMGRRRARSAALLTLALGGNMYIYQGDELGLEEVEDLPDWARQDPNVSSAPGRDGCRVPLPWSPAGPSLGFSGTAQPWLPQPASWAASSVAAQHGQDGSSLELYRSALALRRHLRSSVQDRPLEWLDARPEVLAFRRGALVCVVNLGEEPVRLHAAANVVLASEPGNEHLVGTDAAAWVHSPAGDESVFQ